MCCPCKLSDSLVTRNVKSPCSKLCVHMRFYVGIKIYALHNAGIWQEVSIGLLNILSTLYSLYEHMKHDEYIHVKIYSQVTK